MTNALNLVVPINQDPQILAKLQAIKANFAAQIQKTLDDALRVSKIVHYARVFVIDDKYLLVITEFDGDEKVYTEFFRQKLLALFSTVFSLAVDAPTAAQMGSADE